MPEIETRSAFLPDQEIAYRQRTASGSGVMSEGWRLVSQCDRKLLEIKPSHHNRTLEYYTALGKKHQLTYLLDKFQRALLSIPSNPIAIPIENESLMDEALALPDNGFTAPVRFRNTAIGNGAEEAKTFFLDRIQEPSSPLLLYPRNIFAHYRGITDDKTVEFTGAIETKIQGVICDYRYPPDWERPVRTLVVKPLF